MTALDIARGSLATAEHDVELLRDAADAADGALRAAVEHAIPGADLVALRGSRSRARKAVEEAESKLPRLRAEVVNEDQRQTIAAEQERARLAAEEKRAEDQRQAEALAARLAGPLAALDAAEQKAREASHTASALRASVPALDHDQLVVRVLELRPSEARALDGALVRAVVAGEQLVTAAVDVEALDPRRPEARRARAVAAAGDVHAMEADIGEALFLFGAARALLVAGLEEITKIAARNPDKPIADLARALARLDAARCGVPLSPLVPVAAWLGAGAVEHDALGAVAHACLVVVPAGVSPADAGRAALAGEAHGLAALSAERTTVAALAACVASVDALRGPVAASLAAAKELRFSRSSGRWHGERDTREPFLRSVIARGAHYLAGQIPPLMHADDPGDGPYLVRTFDGGPQIVQLPHDAPASMGPRGVISGPRPNARAQLVAYLGLVGTPEEELVPEPPRRGSSVDPMVQLARGTAFVAQA